MGLWARYRDKASKFSHRRKSEDRAPCCAVGMGDVAPPPDRRSALQTASAAIVEELERRVHLSGTLHCYMSAQATGSQLNDYAVTVFTTGLPAARYTINWNDPNPGGTKSMTYTAPPNGAPFTKSYQYKGTYTGTITAVATASNHATATAYFALDSSFGNVQGVQGTGASVYNPYGNIGNVGQTSMVVDNLNNPGDPMAGAIFVAGAYTQATGGTLFGITAFNSQGQFISSWGSLNGVANNGTYVVPGFGGGSDEPSSIAIGIGPLGETQLIVAGRCATGWAICAINTSLNSNITSTAYGNPIWNTPSYFQAGQANAVEVDSTDGAHLVAVGTDGTHIVVAALYMAESFAEFTDWTNPIITVPFTSNEIQAGANAVIELDDAGIGAEEVLVGGYTDWNCGVCGGCGGGCGINATGSDYTLVAISDFHGGVDNVTRTNIGQTCSACALCSPSMDSVYSLVGWKKPGGGLYVDAVGQSNAFARNITLAQYGLSNTGVPVGLYTPFGQYGDGIAAGPVGNAYSAALVNPTTGAFVVTGDNGGDIITCQFTSLGALDPTFGNAGVMYQDLGSSSSNTPDYGFGVLYDSVDQTILIVGDTLPTGTNRYQIALVEYQGSNNVQIS